jgi:myo-inositol-1(or 4)-monophosphatase
VLRLVARVSAFGFGANKPYPAASPPSPVCCDQPVTTDQQGLDLGPAELGALGELAIRLARGAGQIARVGRRAGFEIDTKTTATDVVTEVDRRVERWLTDAVAVARPGDGVLGEEGADDDGHSRVRWVLDPIDGTVNFTLGLPLYAVSVAVELDGEVVAGCVHNPESGDTYRAVRGQGAFLARPGEDEIALNGPREVPLERMVVGTGFGYDSALRREQARVLPLLLPNIGDIRRLGAASLDLCAVAAGSLDGYFELGLHVWDYAAGLLVAHEAGCKSSGLRGRPAGTAFAAVCGAPVAEDFFALLSRTGADLPNGPSGRTSSGPSSSYLP